MGWGRWLGSSSFQEACPLLCNYKHLGMSTDRRGRGTGSRRILRLFPTLVAALLERVPLLSPGRRSPGPGWVLGSVQQTLPRLGAGSWRETSRTLLQMLSSELRGFLGAMETAHPRF